MLDQRTILIVEDEDLISADLVDAIASAGARVLGPARTVGAARRILAAETGIAAAVLDVQLQIGTVWPLVETLCGRSIPILFLTGSDTRQMPLQYQHLPHCRKPMPMPMVVDRLRAVLDDGGPGKGAAAARQ